MRDDLAPRRGDFNGNIVICPCVLREVKGHVNIVKNGLGAKE
jgi:hypothetical protein